MKREFLKELGLEKEVIDKIMDAHGNDIEGLKGQIETLEADKENLTQQIAEASKQIESFKEMDIDGIKQAAETAGKAAEDWKQKFEEAEAAGKEKMDKLQIDIDDLKDQLEKFKDEKIPQIVKGGTGGSSDDRAINNIKEALQDYYKKEN